jgi:hypothetical protein
MWGASAAKPFLRREKRAAMIGTLEQEHGRQLHGFYTTDAREAQSTQVQIRFAALGSREVVGFQRNSRAV